MVRPTCEVMLIGYPNGNVPQCRPEISTSLVVLSNSLDEKKPDHGQFQLKVEKDSPYLRPLSVMK